MMQTQTPSSNIGNNSNSNSNSNANANATMEQQVFSAALAMISPTTDSQTRSAASAFLEQWTRTPEAWLIYESWLQSFYTDSNVGMQLLCLTLLQSKIRRDVQRASPPALQGIRHVILDLLATLAVSDKVLANPLCSCLAAMSARMNHLKDVVDMCTLGSPTPTHFKLLGALPLEVEACADLTTPQVTAELWPHMEAVLDAVRRALVMEETAIAALECLR